MMASPMRLTRGLQRPCQALRSQQQTLLRQGCLRRSFMSTRCLKQPRPYPQPSAAISSAPTTVSSSFLRTFMASAPQLKTSKRAHNNEPIPDGPPTTDFSRMDMLSQAPAPSTSVDICSSDGFKLNSGVSIYDGKGVVLLGGEAFEWQPWGTDKRLVNKKGQWEVPEAAFGMFDLVWPRPDLLILGLGPSMLPLSPTTKKYLSSLGLRVEVLDTRNAASQFNLLATERGIEEVAAALIPIGWKEGVGANHYN